MAEFVKYEPTPAALKVHVRATVPSTGRRVAVGGDVKVSRTPPNLPYIVREATQAEMAELFEKKVTLSIQPVRQPERATAAEPKEQPPKAG